MQRRGGTQRGEDAPLSHDTDNRKVRRTTPGFVLGAVLLLSLCGGGALYSAGVGGGGGGALGLQRGASGGGGGGASRLMQQVLRGGSAAQAGASESEGGRAADCAQDADFRPGAAGEWGLTDDALDGEGIRLELVTTAPYGDKSTFCDSYISGAEHMQKVSKLARGGGGGGRRAAAARAGPRGLSRSDQGVEGAASGGITCAATSFYLVDQEDEFSDKIVDFVVNAEAAVIDLYTGLLSASACKPLANGIRYHCAASLTPAFVAGRRLTVLDYGANAGFFTQMPTRLGFHSITVDPQVRAGWWGAAGEAARQKLARVRA